MKDILPPKKLDITLQKKDHEPREQQASPAPSFKPNASKVKMMKSLASFKTLLTDTEVSQMLEKTKLKPLERIVQSSVHSNSLKKHFLRRSSNVKGVTTMNDLRAEYKKQARELKLPMDSLRSQIDHVNESLKNMYQKEKQASMTELLASTTKARPMMKTFCKSPDAEHRPSEIHYGSYLVLSEKLSKTMESLSKRQPIFLSDLSLGTEMSKTSNDLSQYCINSDTSQTCRNCRFKEKVIADLENMVYQYAEELKKLKGKTGKSSNPPKSANANTTIEACLRTIKEMQHKLDEKDTKINRIENLLKTLQFYNCFNTQQSHFVEYISEMKRIESENQKLRDRMRLLQQEIKLEKKPKKPTLALEAPPQLTNQPSGIKSEKMSPPEQLKKCLEAVGTAAIEMQTLTESEEFFDSLGNLTEPLVPPEIVEMFAKEERGEDESEESEGSESEDSFPSSDSESKEPRYKRVIKKKVKRSRKRINEGMNILIDYLKTINPPKDE